jgi:hypothetical protein
VGTQAIAARLAHPRGQHHMGRGYHGPAG